MKKSRLPPGELVPAVYLAFWRVQPGVPPGVGRMTGFLYTLYDNTFEVNWVIVP